MNEPLDKVAVTNVIEFLKSNVPPGNVSNIESELKTEFSFAKKKGKVKEKKKPKKKRVYLSRKERKALNFYDLSKSVFKYEDYIPMNLMWNEYISKILQVDENPCVKKRNWDIITQSLYKADFHGAIFKVVRSLCPSYIDKVGICIMETKNTIKLVSKNNKLTTIPKKECAFELYVKDKTLLVFGKHLCARPAERSSKKIKIKALPDL